jgi:hypothetical protein
MSNMSKMPLDILYQEANPQMEEVNYGVSLDKLSQMLGSGKLEFEVGEIEAKSGISTSK